MKNRSKSRNGRIATALKFTLFAAAVLSVTPGSAMAQNVSLDGPWSGQVVCQLNMQSPTYTRQETQTWTISGPQSQVQGQMHMYPVTWTATGSGSAQRNQNGQTFTAQWSLTPSSTNGTFVIAIRPSDGRLIFRTWHSQLHADFSLRGMKQGTWNGTLQQPSAISFPTLEWRLPWMDADATSSNPSGTFSVSAEGLSAEITNPPEMQRIASCSWHFSGGSANSATTPVTNPNNGASGNGGSQNSGSPTTNNSNCVHSAGDIVQNFAQMKADVEKQFDQLIREATDPATAQSLQAQKQITLASLDAQEQKDLQSTSSGCPQGAGGGGASGSAGHAGTGGAAGAGASGAGNSSASGGASGSAGHGGGAGTASGGAASGGAGVSGASGNAGSTASAGTASGGAASGNGNVASGAAGAGAGASGNTAAAGGASSGGSTNATNANSTPVHQSSLASPRMLGTINIGSSVQATSQFGTASDNYVYEFNIPTNAQAVVTLTTSNPATNFSMDQYSVPIAKVASAAMSSGAPASVTISSNGSVTSVILDLRAVNWNAATANCVLTVSGQAIPVQGATRTTLPASVSGINTPVSGIATPINKPITTPIASGAGSSAPKPASSSYKVAISGIICTRAASSSDAIYAAAYSRHYDRSTGKISSSSNGATDPAATLAALQSGNPVPSGATPATSMAQSVVYGDTNGWIGKRQQAGSRSPSGGIGIGDMIPTPPAFVPGVPSQLPLQSNLFPLNVWQGSLTDGADAVVISPSIWINYGDNPMFTTWKGNEQSMDNSLLLDSHIQSQISSQTLGPLYLGPSATGPGSIQSTATTLANDSSQTLIASFFMIPPVMLLFDHPTHDRPVGVADGSYVGESHIASTYTYVPNATIVLTREILEKALGGRPWAVVAVNFKDTTASFNDVLPGSDRKAEYNMFIQIQRQ